MAIIIILKVVVATPIPSTGSRGGYHSQSVYRHMPKQMIVHEGHLHYVVEITTPIVLKAVVAITISLKGKVAILISIERGGGHLPQSSCSHIYISLYIFMHEYIHMRKELD
jgi:hypothetical protein